MSVQFISAQENNSLGLGFGPQYGGIGLNLEYQVSNNANISFGLGSTIITGIGYSMGFNLYLIDWSNTWRPRISLNYGFVGAVKLEEENNGTFKKKYDGLTIGLGQKWMWGENKRHGLDLDIFVIIVSNFNQQEIDDFSDFITAKENHVIWSLGYRFGF